MPWQSETGRRYETKGSEQRIIVTHIESETKARNDRNKIRPCESVARATWIMVARSIMINCVVDHTQMIQAHSFLRFTSIIIEIDIGVVCRAVASDDFLL
mmetsp:Transcript_6185/g.17617  ORF Transcript_6185/g.17617 Transcript_6185/m.17617 type:complete len:100 (+) Transcript_6185:141-440(+)